MISHWIFGLTFWRMTYRRLFASSSSLDFDSTSATSCYQWNLSSCLKDLHDMNTFIVMATSWVTLQQRQKDRETNLAFNLTNMSYSLLFVCVCAPSSGWHDNIICLHKWNHSEWIYMHSEKLFNNFSSDSFRSLVISCTFCLVWHLFFPCISVLSFLFCLFASC